MTAYNTGSDVANTAVRAFLTRVGEFYLGRNFNIKSGRAKIDWERIRDEVFGKKCAYCEKKFIKLQIEHLIMFNRKEFGLHHPGNVVPVCSNCNNRRVEEGIYINWEKQLKTICQEKGEIAKFKKRKDKIKKHIKKEKYPKLSKEEQNAIRVIAESLYSNTKSELDKSIELYKELDKAFVKK